MGMPRKDENCAEGVHEIFARVFVARATGHPFNTSQTTDKPKIERFQVRISGIVFIDHQPEKTETYVLAAAMRFLNSSINRPSHHPFPTSSCIIENVSSCVSANR